MPRVSQAHPRLPRHADRLTVSLRQALLSHGAWALTNEKNRNTPLGRRFCLFFLTKEKGPAQMSAEIRPLGFLSKS